MISRKVIPKVTSNTNFYSKYGPKNKVETVKEDVYGSNKENDQNTTNSQTIDLSKKIRKRSPKKMTKQITKEEKFNGFKVYKDEDIGIEEQFSCMTRPQRIDNDVDTDEEQIESGITRLNGFLMEALTARMYNDFEQNEMEM